jgi:glycosyltransferase involved in cell wall biosynthesis
MPKMKTVPISVVTSVFNGEAFLGQAIESILDQSFLDFEFLVIDDGSTDSTPKIISNYAHRDKRIRVVRHDNRGRAESLNIGIGLASGKYIARMDADDVALPHRLEKQIEFMEQNPGVGVLGGAYDLINVNGDVINRVRPPLEDTEIRSLMLRYNPMCHPTVVMKKDIALASGGYRAALLDADDYDLFLRMAERSKLANLQESVLQYRLHAGQVSVRNLKHQTFCVVAARYAASVRGSGRTDPLSNVTEISAELLSSFGVAAEEINYSLSGAYSYWIETLGQSDPEGSLRMIQELLELGESGYIERQDLANAWWRAGGIHLRRGRPGRALLAIAHAALANPDVAKRFVKWPFKRIITALNGRPKPYKP